MIHGTYRQDTAGVSQGLHTARNGHSWSDFPLEGYAFLETDSVIFKAPPWAHLLSKELWVIGELYFQGTAHPPPPPHTLYFCIEHLFYSKPCAKCWKYNSALEEVTDFYLI